MAIEDIFNAVVNTDYIHVDAGAFVGAEDEKLRWLIETVQEVTDIALF